MCFAEGLARFALASWQAMARTGGIGNKIYSPYSAFIALMMVALLSSGDAKTEILHTLNVDNCEISNKRLALELAHFIEQTEYAEAFYNTGFEAVIERVEKLHECYINAVSNPFYVHDKKIVSQAFDRAVTSACHRFFGQ